MEGNRTVNFRDVAEHYFSDTRVDCRYTISSQHDWSSHDWIGLFKVNHNVYSLQLEGRIPALLHGTVIFQ